MYTSTTSGTPSPALCFLSGVHPKIISEIPGHSSVAFILDTYSHVELDPGDVILTKFSPSFVGGDANGNDILDVDETWTWDYQTTISVDTTFVITGYGEVVGLGNIITYPDYPDEQASVEVKVTGATRTLGFWKTHLGFTTFIFETYLGDPPSIDLGWKNVTSIDDLMGIFWANVAKNADGSKRSNLCKAKVQASWQTLAAILNSSMPGGAPLPASLTPSDIADILGGDDS